MAEDFHDLVDVGSSDEHINSVDADGVAFAAIQGLADKLEEKDDRIEELEADRDELRAENEVLRERLSALEDQVANVAQGAGVSTAQADD
jgi:chromosome segregation ATPase